MKPISPYRLCLIVWSLSLILCHGSRSLAAEGKTGEELLEEEIKQTAALLGTRQVALGVGALALATIAESLHAVAMVYVTYEAFVHGEANVQLDRLCGADNASGGRGNTEFMRKARAVLNATVDACHKCKSTTKMCRVAGELVGELEIVQQGATAVNEQLQGFGRGLDNLHPFTTPTTVWRRSCRAFKTRFDELKKLSSVIFQSKETSAPWCAGQLRLDYENSPEGQYAKRRAEEAAAEARRAAEERRQRLAEYERVRLDNTSNPKPCDCNWTCPFPAQPGGRVVHALGVVARVYNLSHRANCEDMKDGGDGAVGYVGADGRMRQGRSDFLFDRIATACQNLVRYRSVDMSTPAFRAPYLGIEGTVVHREHVMTVSYREQGGMGDTIGSPSDEGLPADPALTTQAIANLLRNLQYRPNDYRIGIGECFARPLTVADQIEDPDLKDQPFVSFIDLTQGKSEPTRLYPPEQAPVPRELTDATSVNPEEVIRPPVSATAGQR